MLCFFCTALDTVWPSTTAISYTKLCAHTLKLYIKECNNKHDKPVYTRMFVPQNYKTFRSHFVFVLYCIPLISLMKTERASGEIN